MYTWYECSSWLKLLKPNASNVWWLHSVYGQMRFRWVPLTDSKLGCPKSEIPENFVGTETIIWFLDMVSRYGIFLPFADHVLQKVKKKSIAMSVYLRINQRLSIGGAAPRNWPRQTMTWRPGLFRPPVPRPTQQSFVAAAGCTHDMLVTTGFPTGWGHQDS